MRFVEQQSASAGAQHRARSGAAASPRTLLDDTGIRRSLVRIAHEMVERVDSPERLYLVAIPNGGVPLARHLARNLAEIADLDVPVGVLDTTLYRDDLLSTGERPALRRTEMPSAVDERVVVLVDDEDMEAVLAYLTTIGAVAGELPPPPNEFDEEDGFYEEGHGLDHPDR